ncbi:MAG: CoB--CoM heterodisulfide reductase iron-sulfur subunit A family protein [Desulfovermiculus sp.]|nr:CoB--CoM heterodisulfide reductase iron-sulfur subunit A family protein [Desulfovermiculus sp.]
MNNERQTVVIIGSGITGLTAAQDLADYDLNIHLVEKEPFLGGHAIAYNCKATEECRQCDACTVEKALKQVLENPNITVHRGSKVVDFSTPAPYTLTIEQSPLFDGNQDQAILAQNYDSCPVHKGILKGTSPSHDPLYAVNPSKITELKTSLGQSGLDLDQEPNRHTVTADSVILASGFVPFAGEQKTTYNYGQLPNVVTAMDMELMKKEYGSYLRASDQAAPQKVAFIQCVGSRNEQFGHLWCSHVCCPYALRMAEVMKSQDPQAQVSIYYMDIQNIGKESPLFYNQCRDDLEFIRTIPVDIYAGEDDHLLVSTVDEYDGSLHNKEHDLVILSVGIMPGEDNPSLARLLDLNLTGEGFFQVQNELDTTSTPKPGIYLAGTTTGPKSIAESISHAGLAVRQAAKYLGVSK